MLALPYTINQTPKVAVGQVDIKNN